jgi:hypothetical protein
MLRKIFSILSDRTPVDEVQVVYRSDQLKIIESSFLRVDAEITP